MKKVVYFVGVIISLVSGSFILAKDEDSEKRVGNVGAYERVLIASSEECIKNIVRWTPHTGVECVVKTGEDSDEELIFYSKTSAIYVPFKEGSKAHVSAMATSSNSYEIRARTYYIGDDFSSRIPTDDVFISLEEFSDLVGKLLKEKGAKLPVKYLKIEKQ